MKLVILTGNQPRHRYVANALTRAFRGAVVYSEGKVYNPANDMSIPDGFTPEQEALWRWHFGLAHAEELKSFGSEESFVAKQVYQVPKGELNNPEWAERIAALTPDAIAVYGTSLLKGPILEICPDATLNMHLGLSPYYRGSATNFWPLYNNEPEYVGVTIHKIDPGIDTGALVHQGRPIIEKGDNQHAIGNKAMMVGTELMIKALHELEAGTITFVPQVEKGKLYQRKDFSVDNLRPFKALIEGGMIDRYAEAPKDVTYVH